MKSRYDLLEDEKLLSLVSRGNREAFTSLYHRYWEELYRSAQKVLGDREQSMDTVQEVFIWIWENREKWNARNIRSYLHAAVKYKSSNLIRKGKLREEAFLRWEEVQKDRVMEYPRTVEIKELQRVIMDFTGYLPERCREVFRLSRFEHLTNKEIAARLNISEKTVENHITIALRRLKRHLGYMTFWLILILFF